MPLHALSRGPCRDDEIEKRISLTLQTSTFTLKYGGGGGIRTHGPVKVNGFQDRPIRPLSHPTASSEKYRQAHHLCQAVCINAT